MPDKIDRREFIIRLGTATGAAVLIGAGALLLHNKKTIIPSISLNTVKKNFAVEIPSTFPQMIMAHGDSPSKNVLAAIEELNGGKGNGIKHFIKKGDSVLVKPNAGWDRIPEQAANTNPEVIAMVIKLCLEAGARKVIVTDASCNEPKRTFLRSGIEKAVLDSGGIVELPVEHKFKVVPIGGVVLKNWLVYSTYLTVDKVINIPVVKHHNLTGATLGMKNWYGILGGRRNQLHQQINESIVDLATFIKPTLTILDGTRILMKNGPQGGSLSDVKVGNTIAVSTDPVAIDAYGALLLGRKPEDIGYIALANQNKLGEINYKNIRYKEINVT